MDWNKKKNDLTWKLFAEGYTPDNYPDYVRWDATHYEFEYTPEYVYKSVLESPCGLLMKGEDFSGYMSYMGIDWRFENNNSVHRCPFNKTDCELNHEYLREGIGHKGVIVQCAFRFSNKAYDYEASYEKVWDEFYTMQGQKQTAFYNRLKWNSDERHCNCIRWDDVKQGWYARYDPEDCAHGCHVRGVCVLTGRQLEGKKGNVFYDLKITRIRKDGSFWNGEKIVNIIKGKKMFDSPKPLTICEAYARICKNWILDREKDRFYQEMFFNKDTTVEVMNIRAEFRGTRDLVQDLRDAQEGIEVQHASDIVKAEKQAKRERREKNNTIEKRVKKIIKRIGKDKLLQIIELNKQDYYPDEIAETVEISKSYIYKIIKMDIDESMFEKPERAEVEQLSLF